MPKKFFNKRILYLFAVLILVLFYYVGFLKPVKSGFNKVLSYPLSWAYGAGTKVTAFFDIFKNNRALIDTNQALNEKNVALEKENVDLKKNLLDQQAGAEQVAFVTHLGARAVVAHVIAKGVAGNANTFMIDKGSAAGLRNGMAVVVQDGLVLGKVIGIEKETASVLLLIDSSSEISAAEGQDQALVGVVKGNLDLSLRLEYVLKDTPLSKGDLIITSGQEELVPAGLIVGTVDEVFEDSRELFKSARLIQPLGFKNVSVVSVIIP